MLGLTGLLVVACQFELPRPTPTATLTTEAPSVTVEPSDPEPIAIVESGFTAFSEGGADFASFGIVLTNPNDDWTVFRTEVLVDFFDAEDQFVAGEEVFLTLLPEQTSAIAGEAFGAGRATRMEIGLPDDTTGFRPAAPTAETFDVDESVTTRADGLNVTRGRLTSRFNGQQRLVQVAAIYRDGSGRIVGGALGGIDALEPGAAAEFEIVDSAPYLDVDTTEVYWQVSGITR